MDNVETMAYVGEVPWHGLGNNVDPGMSPEEMLVAAEIDWTVSKRPIRAFNSADQLKAGAYTIEVPDYYALVRDSDSYVLGVAGKGYVPFQNKDVVQFFDRFVTAGSMTMETMGSLDHGRHIWALANLAQGFTLAGGDEVRGYMLMNQPHIWGQAAVFMFTPIRVVCWNTLQLALNTDGAAGRFRAPHVTEFGPEVVRQAEIALGLAEDRLSTFKEQAELLSKTKIENMKKLIEYYINLFQPKDNVVEYNFGEMKRNASMAYEAFVSAPGAKLESANNTWWGAFNSVTYMVDHVMGRERDGALTEAWFGSRSRLKRNALMSAVEFAQAA